MKDFESLFLEVVPFCQEDVIATSSVLQQEFKSDNSYDTEDWF